MVQLLYWLSLSTWFGSVLFIMIAHPVIFRTVRENNPILSHVLSVNLDGQHGELLADTIVYNLIQRLLLVELICGVTLLLALIVQPFLINLSGGNGVGAIVRSGLFLLAAGVAYFDWQFVWPKIRKNRAEYIDHADEPEIANPAQDRFNQEQRKSLYLLMIMLTLLLGIILFSSSIGTFVLVDTTQKVAK